MINVEANKKVKKDVAVPASIVATVQAIELMNKVNARKE
jgi:hypothetical protein